MEPVGLPHLAADPEPRYIEIAKDQPEYVTLPALVYNDGRIVTEWLPSEAERQALLRGENIRLTIWAHQQRCPNCQSSQPKRIQPVWVAVTTEDQP